LQVTTFFPLFFWGGVELINLTDPL
jgi:hypothetical protein